MQFQKNFLLHAEVPGERAESDYNLHVADALSNAYAFITPVPRRRDAFQLARKHLLRHANRPMSRRQRARILYILGMACTDEGSYPHAADYLDEALDHAMALHGFAEVAKLAYLLGIIQGEAYRYRLAAGYHAFALDALSALAEEGQGPYPPEPALAADATISLASCHFALERYDVADRHIADAARYITFLAPGSKQLAWLLWIQALSQRWRGQPAHALPLAMEAAAVYSSTDSPAGQSRIEGIVADCACDLAESSPSASHSREAYLTLALPHAKRALDLTAGGTDVSGRALALLCEIRLARLTGRPYNWLVTAEAIIADASSSSDRPLVAQAYTTLGDQFTAWSEREAGLRCYRAALDALAGTDALTLRRRPRQAILLDSEMRVE